MRKYRHPELISQVNALRKWLNNRDLTIAYTNGRKNGYACKVGSLNNPWQYKFDKTRLENLMFVIKHDLRYHCRIVQNCGYYGASGSGKDFSLIIYINKDSKLTKQENVAVTNTIDWTRPVQTRNGRKVRVLATDLKGVCPVAIAVPSHNNVSDYIERCRLDGRIYPYLS